MAVFIFNPAETGLRKTLREYQEIALRYIWSLGDEGAGSGKAWEHTNRELGEGKSISRVSIVMYLNRMVEEGVLGFRDVTGKGRHHKIYITKLDESGYKKYLVKTLLNSVTKDYPNETKEVLQTL